MLIKLMGIIINIFSIIVLLIGLLHNFEKPKNKANYGYSTVACMLFYVIGLSIVLIYELFTNINFYCIVLFLCILSPFIIGRLVKYETVKQYTVVQIICFVISLVTLLMKF